MPLGVAAVLVAAVLACRQADGPAPTPTPDQSNEIADISRDMMNVVNKDPQAPDDLRSDLMKYSPNEAASREIAQLARDLTQALASARLEDQTAQRLAQTLWLGLTAKDFSERQIEALEAELKTVLASAGVTEERAQPIADRLGEVQKAITDNPRRWYQVF